MTVHHVSVRLGPPYIEAGPYWRASCICGKGSPRMSRNAAEAWKTAHSKEQTMTPVTDVEVREVNDAACRAADRLLAAHPITAEMAAARRRAGDAMRDITGGAG